VKTKGATNVPKIKFYSIKRDIKAEIDAGRRPDFHVIAKDHGISYATALRISKAKTWPEWKGVPAGRQYKFPTAVEASSNIVASFQKGRHRRVVLDDESVDRSFYDAAVRDYRKQKKRGDRLERAATGWF
jgi:hypothetical protein